ncbi:hypothetical protein NF27_FE00030 [Candidatus Jidaibacter acanthamoeba]|uniref:Protein-PII uridylyltransferase N-terminal domain-containing protein n=1 Tax=Candidatus Jidaibacter acanthamoebae TaxID=86105 RepID=A0A0C1MYA3_9RICK|nr:tetratricopeptide repeat protein [Candidatus Jidaibacter acanthamoeba]KIE04896.1 hypothetical protein NF27_FE00030 [Candidatus Jidaibacter acanthamoeba]
MRASSSLNTSNSSLLDISNEASINTQIHKIATSLFMGEHCGELREYIESVDIEEAYNKKWDGILFNNIKRAVEEYNKEGGILSRYEGEELVEEAYNFVTQRLKQERFEVTARTQKLCKDLIEWEAQYQRMKEGAVESLGEDFKEDDEYNKNTGEKLRDLSAAGDDRNLIGHGEDRKYWYSVTDGFRLLVAIRNSMLHPFDIEGKEEERYTTHRENEEGIFIADPYHSDNFNQYLRDDIARITGSHEIEEYNNDRWQSMPRVIVLPILYGLHWRCVRIEIDYKSKESSILYDDPYGVGHFPKQEMEKLLEVIKEQIRFLIRTELENKGVEAGAEEIEVKVKEYEKNIDQQGSYENSYDCGVIVFSNIRDYSRGEIRNEVYAEASGEEVNIYSLSPITRNKHEEGVIAIRARHIRECSKVTGIELNNDRLEEIEESIRQGNKNKAESLRGNESNIGKKISELPAECIEMIFSVLEQKRALGKGERGEYTEEELEKCCRLLFEKAEEEISLDLIEKYIVREEGKKNEKIDYHTRSIIGENNYQGIKLKELRVEEQTFAAKLKELVYEYTINPISEAAINLIKVYRKLGDLYIDIGRISSKAEDYTDAAVFYHYVLSMVERIEEEQEDTTNQELENYKVQSFEQLAIIWGKLSELVFISIEETTPNQSKLVEQESRDNRAFLKQLREEAEQKVKEIDEGSLKKEEAESAYKSEEYFINESRELFEYLAEQVKGFIARIFKECEEVIDEPPCEYSVIGLGSLALNQFTPYSDLEFAILTENEEYKHNSDPKVQNYFKNLSHLVHFKVICLGETIIPTSKYKINLESFVCRGFNFDLGGKTPLGRIEKDKHYQLIQTPEKMARYLDEKYSHIDKNLPYILEASCFIYGEKELFANFRKKVTKFLNIKNENGIPNYEVRTLKRLKDGVEEFKYSAEHNALQKVHFEGDIHAFKPQLHAMEEEGKLFNVKQEIYRLPDRFIYGLALYFGIEPVSIWDAINKLHENKVIGTTEKGKDAPHYLKYAASFAVMLRLRTYLANKGQFEFMYPSKVLNNLEESLEETKKYFSLPEKELTDKGGLFKYYYSIIPFYNVFKDFCYNSSKSSKDYFNIHNFYDESYENKGLIYKRIIQYSKALECFKKWKEKEPKNNVPYRYIGTLYLMLGDYKSAEDYFKRSLYLLKNKCVFISHIINSLENLAVVCFVASKYNEANQYYNEIFKILNLKIANNPEKVYLQLKKYLIPDNEIADFFFNYGIFLTRIANFSQAELFLKKSLNLKIKLNSDSHLNLANIYNSLGTFYGERGKIIKEHKYYEKALEIRKKSYGEQHNPYLATSYFNLSVTYQKLSLFKKAERYRKIAEVNIQSVYNHRIQTIGESTFDKNDTLHPDSILAKKNKGSFALDQGDYHTAENLLRECLEEYKKIYNNIPHYNTSECLNDLGVTLMKLNKLKEARQCHKQALKMRSIIYGNQDHPLIASSYWNIGATFFSLEIYKRAEKLYKKALNMRNRVFKDHLHPDTATLLNDLGLVYIKCKKYDKALDLFTQALSIQTKVFNNVNYPKPYEMGRTHFNIAACYFYKEQYKDALIKSKLALRIFNSIEQEYCFSEKSKTLKNIGYCYFIEGKFEDAISNYNLAIRNYENAERKKKRGENSQKYNLSEKAESQFYMAQCYLIKGIHNKTYNKESLNFATKAYKDCLEFYGYHIVNANTYFALAGLALTYFSLGEKSEAIKYYNIFSSINEKLKGSQYFPLGTYRNNIEESLYKDIWYGINNSLNREWDNLKLASKEKSIGGVVGTNISHMREYGETSGVKINIEKKEIIVDDLTYFNEKETLIKIEGIIEELIKLYEVGDIAERLEKVKEGLKLCNRGINIGKYYEQEYELFLKLGDIYSRGEDRLDYPKAVGIYQYILNIIYRLPDKLNKEELRKVIENKIGLVEEKFIRQARKDKILPEGYSGEGSLKKIRDYKSKLEGHREWIGGELKKVEDLGIKERGEELDEEGLEKRAGEVERIYQEIREYFIGGDGLIKQLLNDCIDELGGLPKIKNSKTGEDREVGYAIFGMGSMALGTMTPWSDMEWGILIEEGLGKKEEEKVKEYFRNLAVLMYIKVTNFGESLLTVFGVKELNNFKLSDGNDKEHNWFYDSISRRGFSFDGSQWHACKSPLGRERGYNKYTIEDEIKRIVPCKPFELIGTINELMRFQVDEVWYNDDPHLVQALWYTILIAGSKKLLNQYQQKLSNIKTIKPRSFQLLKEDCKNFDPHEIVFNIKQEGEILNIKKEIYRFFDRMIAELGTCLGERRVTIWKIIQSVATISQEGLKNLKLALSIANELRVRTYEKNKGQRENVSYLREYAPQVSHSTNLKLEEEIFYLKDFSIVYRYYYTALPLSYIIKEESNIRSLRLRLSQEQLFSNHPIIKGSIHYKFLKYYEVINELKNTIINEPNIHLKLALAYREVGMNKEALEEIEEISRECNNIDKYIILFNKAQILSAFKTKENYVKACQLYKDSLNEIDRNNFIKQAIVLNELGIIYLNLKKEEKAYNNFFKSLSLNFRTRNEDVIQTASILSNISLILDREKNYEEALQYIQKSLEIAYKIYHGDHKQIAGILDNKSETLANLSRYGEELSCAEEALNMRLRLYKGDHPEIAASYNNIGSILAKQEKFKEALNNYIISFNIRLRLYKGDHSDIIDTKNNILMTLGGLRKYKETQEAYYYISQVVEMLQNLNISDQREFQVFKINLVKFTICLANKVMLSGSSDQALALYLSIFPELNDIEPYSLIQEIRNYAQESWQAGNLNLAISCYEVLSERLIPQERRIKHNLACMYHVKSIRFKEINNIEKYEEYLGKVGRTFELALSMESAELINGNLYTEYAMFLVKYHDINNQEEYTKIQELLNKAIELQNDGSSLGYNQLEKITTVEPLQELLNKRDSITVAPHILAYYLLVKVHIMHGKKEEAEEKLEELEGIMLSFKGASNLSSQQQEEKVLALYLTAYACKEMGYDNRAKELFKKIEKLSHCKQELQIS